MNIATHYLKFISKVRRANFISHQRRPLRRRPGRARPPTCSTPPAGWSRSTPRHVDRRNAEGYLKSGKEMAEVAEDARRPPAGDAARRLLARTARLADRCAVDPRRTSASARSTSPSSTSSPRPPSGGWAPRRCCGSAARPGFGRRGDGAVGAGAAAARRRAGGHRPARLPVLLPHRRRRRRPHQEHGGAGRGAGLGRRQPGHLPARHLRRRPDPLRAADGALPLPAAPPAARHRHRRRVGPPDRGLRRGSSTASAATGSACVSMMDTYRVRHAIRDVGAALGLPPGEIDAARQGLPAHPGQPGARRAARPARAAGQPAGLEAGGGTGDLDLLFDLVDRLDGLPRHIALHPCGVLLSDATLLDRTPVETSCLGFPMSQFDKDDVEELGLLKLDVLGIRMQSAIAHAIDEVARVDGETVDIDAVPRDDPSDLRADPQHPHARHVPDRVARAAGAGRQVRAADVRGPHHRHLAVPARAGEERHGHAVPHGPERLARRRSTRTPTSSSRWRRPRGVVVFHEQVLQVVAPDDRLHPGRGRRGAPGAGGEGRPSRGAGLVRAPGAGGAAIRWRSPSRSGRCSRPSGRSASARPTRRRSRCPPTSRPG